MEQEIRTVIFDQDGLMFDTERLSAVAWNLAGVKYGLKFEESFLCTIRGMVWPQAKVRFLETFGKGLDCDRLRAEKTACFHELLRVQGVPVKPGLLELLAYLKKHCYHIILGTASDREYTEKNLKDAGVFEYFDGLVTGDMVTKAKPDPEIFLKAARLAGEKPGSCLVLEDSLNGVRAGLAGGFHVIMVPDLTQPDEELRARVDAVCSSLSGVIPFLEERA